MYKTLQITIQPLVLLLNLFLSDNTKGRQFILAINMDIKKTATNFKTPYRNLKISRAHHNMTALKCFGELTVPVTLSKYRL